MAKNVTVASPEILHAALQGLEAQRTKLEEQIAQVRALLGRNGLVAARKALSMGDSAMAHLNGHGSGVKRVLSTEARKRIAAAQKKRWAAFRKNQK